jgi:Na+/H+-translocating membrane pyrophosphatase
MTVFFSTLAFAFVEPFFFIGYLISIAVFGLYQAIFMANAGGAWDNAKKGRRSRSEDEGDAASRCDGGRRYCWRSV